MSGSMTVSKAEWVKRVLGLDLGAATAKVPPDADKRRLLEIWRDAKETVDQGIAALQKACLTQKVSPAVADMLHEVAEKGLNGVTNRASVGMMAAMTEAETSPAARVTAMKAVANFEAFLATPVADMIDDNPFGVKIGLRNTFGDALNTIKARLAA
jgi:hypothetical protein